MTDEYGYFYSERFPWRGPHAHTGSGQIWVAALGTDSSPVTVLVSAEDGLTRCDVHLDVDSAQELHRHLGELLTIVDAQMTVCEAEVDPLDVIANRIDATVDTARLGVCAEVRIGNVVSLTTRTSSAQHEGRGYSGTVVDLDVEHIRLDARNVDDVRDVIVLLADVDAITVVNDCLHGGYHTNGTCPETIIDAAAAIDRARAERDVPA